jgi:hypothetical protein
MIRIGSISPLSSSSSRSSVFSGDVSEQDVG